MDLHHLVSPPCPLSSGSTRGRQLLLLTVALFTVGGLGCAPASSTTQSPPATAEWTPSFGIDLDSVTGEPVTIGAKTSTDVLVLLFWKTTCEPCRGQLDEFDDLLSRFGARGLRMWAINVDPPATRSHVEGWIERGQWQLEMLVDSQTEVLGRYNPKGECPFYVVLGADGTVLATHGGYVKGDVHELAELVDVKLPPS